MHMAFGHHPINMGNAHLDCWGRGPLLLRYGGREWWFEFSDMFGPVLLRKSDMEPEQRQPDDPQHPFWEGFNAWTRAGRKHRPIRAKRSRVKNRAPGVKFYICHVGRGGLEV